MPIFFPPPPPFTGGSQPLSPRELAPSIEDVPVNNPPFAHLGRVAALAAVVLLSQPGPPQPFIGGRQPLAPKPLPPSVLAVQVDNPPFPSGARDAEDFWVIRSTWDPAAPAVQVRQLLPQGLVTQVDNPPFVCGSRDAEHFVNIRTSWDLPAPAPQLPRYLVQGAAAQADNPPAQAFDWLPAILQAWQPAPVTVQRPRLLNPSVLAVPVNDPPFGVANRRSARAVIDMWMMRPVPDIPRPKVAAFTQSVTPALTSLVLASLAAAGDGVTISGPGDGVTLSGYGGEATRGGGVG